jgi:hypothetical protein
LGRSATEKKIKLLSLIFILYLQCSDNLLYFALEIVVSKYIERWITVTKVICNFPESHTEN